MSPEGDRDPFDILLVEDSPADAMLVQAALDEHSAPNRVQVVVDGVVAMQYLRREGAYTAARRPGLILLDLNLPRKNGREVLEEVKTDPGLCEIPVVVLTTSSADEDVAASYRLHANGFVTKPGDFVEYSEMMRSIKQFWCDVATLPATIGAARPGGA